MEEIVYIDRGFIEQETDFGELVQVLNCAFANGECIVPMRHHHDFSNPSAGSDTTLLLMPAWSPGKNAGVKVVTISPENGRFALPAVQGIYILLNAENGVVRAIIEAKSLTAKRTAAASALASSFLSRPDAKSLLMIGTGALSINLVQAHATVRPIERVYVWGRNYEKAVAVCDNLSGESFYVEPIATIHEKLSDVDIITAATLSKTPLIEGSRLRPGQHVDLVGSFKADMREADNETIVRGSLFLDAYPGGLKESGDIVAPIQEGIITESDIRADLFGLCKGNHPGRTSTSEITVFKSVGNAIEDLAAANYFFDRYAK